MISVLTLTYKRHHLLEEAIQSFLSQELPPECEMVVINDNPDVDYIYIHDRVKVINHKERFPSISAKIEWGFQQCKYDYIYRLDDDDLLVPWSLNNVRMDIQNNPNYDVYRSKGMYFFINNKFEGGNSNINNGNVYTKAYLERIKWPDTSIGEDADITFHNGAKVYESKLKNTMCYRWGMGTLHISGMGQQPNQVILDQADLVLDDTTGVIELHPQFLSNYYEQINMNRLTEIANRIGTDKGTMDYGHHYTVLYHELLDELSKKHVKMLEIGVADPRFPGASLEMWNEYFPDIELIGYDINKDAKKFEKENVSVFIGDQNNPLHLEKCIETYGGDFDIIVDDGSHYGEHIVTSFKTLYPYLKEGGYYIIEDLHAAQMDEQKMMADVKALNYKMSKFYLAHGGKLLIIVK
jgi:hypothetical protein